MQEGEQKIVKNEGVKAKHKIRVVKELPTQEVRSFIEDGVEYHFMTIEEALSEILNS